MGTTKDYDVMELVREYQVSERDYWLALGAAENAKNKLDLARKALGQHLCDVESVAAPSLDGDMVLYYVDEDGDFQQRDIGRVLMAGERER